MEDTPELEEGPSSEEAGMGLCEPPSEGSGLHTQEVPSRGSEELCEAGEDLPAAQDE